MNRLKVEYHIYSSERPGRSFNFGLSMRGANSRGCSLENSNNKSIRTKEKKRKRLTF